MTASFERLLEGSFSLYIVNLKHMFIVCRSQKMAILMKIDRNDTCRMTLTRMLQTLTLQQISLACSHPVASMLIGDACSRKNTSSSAWSQRHTLQSCKKECNHEQLSLIKIFFVMNMQNWLFSNSVSFWKRNGTNFCSTLDRVSGQCWLQLNDYLLMRKYIEDLSYKWFR